MRAHPSPDHRFGFELLLATVLVIACVASLNFLRSQPGHKFFTDRSSVQHLVPVDSTGSPKGVLFKGGQRGGFTLPLGAVDLDSKSRYLLIAELGAGGRIRFLGVNRRLNGRVEFNCGSRRDPAECHRLLDARELPRRLYFRGIYRGQADLELRGLAVGRLSPLFFWLPPLLRVVLWLIPIGFLLRHRRRLGAQLLDLDARDDVAFALMVFGLCLVVFHTAPVKQLLDSRYLTAVSYSLLHGDGIEMPQSFGPAQRTNLSYRLDRVEGRLLHHYSPVPAVLDAPVVAAYEWLGVTPSTPSGRWDYSTEQRILRFAAAMASAILCVVLYLTARRLLAPLYSLGLALAFAFGTQIFSTLSRPYWSHTWGAVLAALAIYFVVFPLPKRETLSAVLGATCVSWSFFCRPQNFWTVIGLVAFLLLSHRWRQLAVFTGVGIGWAALGLVFSLAVYDSVLPTYFFREQVSSGRLGAQRLERTRYSYNSLGSLLSPSRGLFVYVPLYAWILAITAISWKRLASRTAAVVALGVIGFHLWMLVHTGTWPGGQQCFGPRQMSDVLVWFFLLAVLAVEAMLAGWPQTPRLGRWLRVATLGACLAVSVFINARGAWVRATWRWQPRKAPRVVADGAKPIYKPDWWDWRDPQFLAGLLPRPERPEERTGPPARRSEQQEKNRKNEKKRPGGTAADPDLNSEGVP